MALQITYMTFFFHSQAAHVLSTFPALLGPNATEEKKTSCYKLMLDLSVTVGLSFSATLWVK